MNKVVRKEMLAGELPAGMRGDIDPENRVRVIVEDLGGGASDVERVLALAGAAAHRKTSIEDAVARIRLLRDEE